MSDANVQPLIAKHLAPWLCLGEASVTDDERWRDLKGKKQNERDRGGEWGKSGSERWSSTRADNNRSVLYKDKKQETEEDREPSFSESKSQVAPVSSNCGDEAEGSETLSTLLWKKLREGERHEATTPAADAFWGLFRLWGRGQRDDNSLFTPTSTDLTVQVIQTQV